jgi:hypothetical protein
LASGVARETHAKLVVAALGDVLISEDEARRGDHKRRPLAPLLQSLALAVRCCERPLRFELFRHHFAG